MLYEKSSRTIFIFHLEELIVNYKKKAFYTIIAKNGYDI